MFSETDLGVFLRGVYSGSHPELMQSESTLALAMLLLADASIACNDDILTELRRVLASVYGDVSAWRCHEEPPNKEICSELESVLDAASASGHEKAAAYLSGLLGKRRTASTPSGSHKAQHIHAKGLRIFHSEYTALSQHGRRLFFCLIGLKGSGKSSILRLLEKDDQEVLEIYRDLDKIRIEDAQAVVDLPSRTDWEDEPLRLSLKERGISNSSAQRQVFIGSLLRRSEVDLLSSHGRVVIIHLVSTNAARHTRTKSRRREIEKLASQERLVELDAHRDGLWPEYEQNDLGGLVDLCHYSLVNDENMCLDRLYRNVRGIIEKEQQNGPVESADD